MARRVILHFVQIASLFFLLVGCSFSINTSAGLIRITDVETCSQIPIEGRCVETTSSFPPNTNIVYAAFYLEGPGAVELEFRWSQGDSTLAAGEYQVEPGYRYVWFSTNPDEALLPGRYQLEILTQGKVMAETTFWVAQSARP